MTSSNPTSPFPMENTQTIQITRVESRGGPSPLADSQPQSTPPPEVQTENKSGVEDGALVLAKQFMSKMGNLARKCQSRGALSELYLTTQSAWASPEVMANESLQRHFKQVLFAIAHGMKLVRVRDQGRSLFWNRYRDNEGNQLEEERAKYTERRQDRANIQGSPQRDFHDDRRGGQRDFHDDRRGGQRDYRDDRRGGQRDYRDDRRGGQRDYRDDRRGGQRERRSGTPDSKGWITAGGNSRSHHRSV